MENQYRELAKYVELAQKGNESAFGDIYQRTHQKVYFYALQLTQDKSQAEDIVQEVFAGVMEDIHGVTNPLYFIAWLNKKTYFITMNYLRKENKYILKEQEDHVFEMNEQGHDINPELSCLEDEKERVLMRGINSLSANHKSVILMRYYQNLSMSDIALLMECSLGTVKSRLNTAKKYLKEVMVTNQYVKALFFIGFPWSKETRSTLMNWSKNHLMTTERAVQIGEKAGITGTTATAINIVGSKGTGLLFGISIKAIVATSIASVAGITMMATSFIDINPSIERINTVSSEPYINHPALIEVYVSHESEVAEVLGISHEGQTYKGVLTKENIYTIEVDKNSSYDILLKKDRKVIEKKKIEVDSIDMEQPFLSHNELGENQILLTVIDEISGIDYEKTSMVSASGEKINPINIEKNTGQFIYTFSGETLIFKVFDKAGNTHSYKLIGTEEKNK